MRRPDGDQAPDILKKSKHLLKGLLAGLAGCMLLILIASFGVSRGFLPETAIRSAALACCLVGALIGSLLFARRSGSRFLINGLIFGVSYFLALYILGALLFLRFLPQGGAGGILLFALVGGVLGGVLGAGVKKRRR